jgi:hypothetical protein
MGTPEIRKRALRCHHIYDIKRDSSAKNRVVVNGSKQHADTQTQQVPWRVNYS